MRNELVFFTLLMLLFGHAQGLGESPKEVPNELDAASVLKDIGEKINNGEDIYYYNKTIKGDLDFGALNLSVESVPLESENKIGAKRVFPLKIEITNSRIDGQITWSNICFRKRVNFENTIFSKTVNFRGSVFLDKLYLKGAIFQKESYLSEAIFQNEIDLSEAIFQNEIDLSEATFKDFICREASFASALFEGAIFNGSNAIFAKSAFEDAKFQGVRFESEADFSDCVFRGSTDFSYTRFSSGPIFMEAKFLGDAFFSYAQFMEDADFSVLSFDRLIDYSNAEFYNLANFKDSKFNSYALFRNAKFEGNALFDNARFSNDAFFDNATFAQDVSLDQTYYQKLYARWRCLENGLKYNDEACLSLIENYKNLGWFEDANNCYYKYRIEYARQAYDLSLPPISELTNHPRNYIIKWYSLLLNSIYNFIDYLFMVINGYGVKPSRPLILMLFIIPAFGFFYWKADNISFFSAMKFSVVVFLSGSGKLFVEAPDYKPRSSSHLATLSMVAFYLERIAGMVIFIALLVAFSKTVLR